VDLAQAYSPLHDVLRLQPLEAGAVKHIDELVSLKSTVVILVCKDVDHIHSEMTKPGGCGVHKVANDLGVGLDNFPSELQWEERLVEGNGLV